MVLILPESRQQTGVPEKVTVIGLRSAVEEALRSECEEDLSRLVVRVLGERIILEGLVEDEDCLDEIRSIAEDVAGRGHVSLRLFRQ